MFSSDRLTFEYPAEGLASTLARHLCDLGNRRLVSPSLPFPTSPEMILARIRRCDAAPFTGAPNAVEVAIRGQHEDSLYVGMAGLYAINFEHSTAEIGVSILDPATQGQGLGLEAHVRWVEYAFIDLGLAKLTGTVKAHNARALNIAAKIGMRQEGLLRAHRIVAGERSDLVVLGLLRSEWRSPV